jgi:hypothetical protein
MIRELPYEIWMEDDQHPGGKVVAAFDGLQTCKSVCTILNEHAAGERHYHVRGPGVGGVEESIEREINYILKHGVVCPVCVSEDIMSTSFVSLEEDTAHLAMRCEVCHARWDEIYALYGIRNLSQYSIAAVKT